MRSTSLPSFALLCLGLTGTGSAYVVILWQNADCTGDSRSNNVYDNTCSTLSPGFSAVSVDALGGSGQIARFYSRNSCTGSQVSFGFAADGSSPTFKVGACIGFNGVANAAGSFAL